jgi:hypothetical protein
VAKKISVNLRNQCLKNFVIFRVLRGLKIRLIRANPWLEFFVFLRAFVVKNRWNLPALSKRSASKGG